MEFVSTMNAELVDAIKIVRKIKKAIRVEKKEFVQAKVELGWKNFILRYYYYPPHFKAGDDYEIRRARYMFASHINTCGSFSKIANKEEFEEWLATLADDDFIIL